MPLQLPELVYDIFAPAAIYQQQIAREAAKSCRQGRIALFGIGATLAYMVHLAADLVGGRAPAEHIRVSGSSGLYYKTPHFSSLAGRVTGNAGLV